MGISRRFSRFKKRDPKQNDFELQITALADVLIVVLVFLLKSYSTDVDVDLSISQNIRIPEVSDLSQARDGVKVQISESFVELEGKQVSNLKNYRFQRDDLNQSLIENSGVSKSLSSAFRGVTGKEEGRRLWIVADKKAPYRTIQTVLASAALNGYTDFNLAVVKSD